MTVDDPEIVLGGDPAPSAPPLSFNSLPTPVAAPTTQSLPTAVAVPLSGATAPLPSASAPAATAAGASIERQTNADGSLSVKLTTITARPDGGREVKIEYFEVPASMAASVGTALDAGEAPATLYMTKMEQQVLPPGTGEVISAPPAAQAASGANQPSTPNASSAAEYGSGISGPRACALCCGIACCVFVILGIIGGSKSASTTYSSPSYTPPSRPSWLGPRPYSSPSVVSIAPIPFPTPPGPSLGRPPTRFPHPSPGTSGPSGSPAGGAATRSTSDFLGGDGDEVEGDNDILVSHEKVDDIKEK